MNANGYPLVLALLCAGAGVFAWVHTRRQDGRGALPPSTVRIISLCAALASLFFVIGIPPWRDALAGVFATGPGMVVLVLTVLFCGGGFILDVIHHHHAVRTAALGIVGATAGALAWAMAPELGRKGAKLGPKTAAAMGKAMRQIQNGQAAHAETSNARMVIIFLAVVAFVVLVTLMRHHHNARPFENARALGERKAITSGARALPAGSGGGGASRPGILSRAKKFLAGNGAS